MHFGIEERTIFLMGCLTVTTLYHVGGSVVALGQTSSRPKKIFCHPRASVALESP
jgi:hypothetical protein